MKILVLAGGADQIALINELHNRGHKVILIDFYEKPPASLFADKHIVASTLDVFAVKEIAIKECVDLITTACTDQALLTVAQVSKELNLPCYLSCETALNVTNKQYMKSVMINNDIPTARYTIIDLNHIDSINDFAYPLVVKPVDCNSSKGVRKVSNETEFLIALEQAVYFSRTHTAIVEEFKEGKEISADFYIEEAEVKLLSVTSSTKIKNTNSFTILQSCYPAVDIQQEERILRVARQIAESFALNHTPLLIQLIISDMGEINVLEFSARMGGGSKYHLIKTLSGVDIMSTYVDLILGEYPQVSPQKQVNYARMNYVYCAPGVLKEIIGIETLMRENTIDAWFQYKTLGMVIDKAETSGDRVFGFLVTASTQDELQDKIYRANKKMMVLNDAGNDIMLHDLFSN